jgi:hypothetical protein
MIGVSPEEYIHIGTTGTGADNRLLEQAQIIDYIIETMIMISTLK